MLYEVITDECRSKESRAYCPLIIGDNPEIVKIKKMVADIDRRGPRYHHTTR